MQGLNVYTLYPSAAGLVFRFCQQLTAVQNAAHCVCAGVIRAATSCSVTTYLDGHCVRFILVSVVHTDERI